MRQVWFWDRKRFAPYVTIGTSLLLLLSSSSVILSVDATMSSYDSGKGRDIASMDKPLKNAALKDFKIGKAFPQYATPKERPEFVENSKMQPPGLPLTPPPPPLEMPPPPPMMMNGGAFGMWNSNTGQYPLGTCARAFVFAPSS